MKLVVIFFLVITFSFAAEQLTEEEKKEAYLEQWKNRKLSEEVIDSIRGSTTSDLIEQYISTTPSAPLISLAILKELKNTSRTSDLKNAISERTQQEKLWPEEVNFLPKLASIVSVEFEINILRKVTFHPSAKDYDIHFLSTNELRDRLSRSPKTMREFFTRLVDEKRIEANTSTYKKWSAQLVQVTNLKERNVGQNHSLQASQGDRYTANKGKEGNHQEDNKVNGEKNKSLWVIVGVLLLVILALFLKVFKGNSAS